MTVRRCTTHFATRSVTIELEGLWVPWEDHDTLVGELRAVIHAKQVEMDNLDDELAAVRERLGDTTRKLASARSQLSRAKKRKKVTA